MRALVVYESMFGNTRDIAEHIAEGLRAGHDVAVVPACEAHPQLIAPNDVVVAGAPTHAHGLPSAPSRRSAADLAAREDDLDLDVDVSAPGLREWLGAIGPVRGRLAAAFDTRVDGPPLLVGRASRGIARRLRGCGFGLVADPESFLVDRHNHLLPGEAERATAWGLQLASTLRRVSAPSDGDRRRE